jgi:hypothetical protein
MITSIKAPYVFARSANISPDDCQKAKNKGATILAETLLCQLSYDPVVPGPP